MSRKRATPSNISVQEESEVFPPLPKGWCWTTLEAISEIEGGITKDKNRRRTSTTREVPYLRVANVQRGYLDMNEMKTILADDKEIEALRLKKGDILFTEGGDRDKLGRGWVWNEEIEECIHQNHIFRARPSLPFVEPKFVSYHGNFFGQAWFTKTGKQTTNLASINKGILRRFPVPLAPIGEQRRIVAKMDELLSDLDAGVATLERLSIRLKMYRASVLKAAVEGKLTEEWRTKNSDVESGSTLVDRILAERRRKWEEKQLVKFAKSGTPPPRGWQARYQEPVLPDTTEVPPYPESWSVASIDQICTTLTSGSRDWSQFYDRGSGTFLMAQNIRMGRLDLSYRQLVDPPPDNTDRTRSQVEEGDILITIVGANTGDVCRVFSSLPEHYVCQSVSLARPVRKEAAAFVEKYMTSDENGQRQFKRYIYGAGRPHLSFDQIRMTAVLIPPMKEQERIVAEIDRRLSVVDEIESQVRKNLKRSGRLRQSIMKRAFEGRLVPQDPDDEPADRLLERIRERRPNGEIIVDRTSVESHRHPGGNPLPLFDLEEGDVHD